MSKVGPALGRMASGAGKAVTGKTAADIGRGTADVAKSAAQSAAQNADKIGIGLGAYQAITDVANNTMGGVGEVYRDVGKAAGAITQSVGNAIDGKTIAELASTAVKYSIPIGIILAVLYGGKKLIDQVMNIGTGFRVTNLDIINKIASTLNKEVQIKHVEDRLGHDRKYGLFSRVENKSIWFFLAFTVIKNFLFPCPAANVWEPIKSFLE